MIPEDVAANLIAEGDSYEGMPEPWVFDGTRRLYEGGKSDGWTARAVDLSSSIPMTRDLSHVPMKAAEGDTPMLATIALVEKLQQEAG
jgi:hypothetical protein